MQHLTRWPTPRTVHTILTTAGKKRKPQKKTPRQSTVRPLHCRTVTTPSVPHTPPRHSPLPPTLLCLSLCPSPPPPHWTPDCTSAAHTGHQSHAAGRVTVQSRTHGPGARVATEVGVFKVGKRFNTVPIPLPPAPAPAPAPASPLPRPQCTTTISTIHTTGARGYQRCARTPTGPGRGVTASTGMTLVT